MANRGNNNQGTSTNKQASGTNQGGTVKEEEVVKTTTVVTDTAAGTVQTGDADKSNEAKKEEASSGVTVVSAEAPEAVEVPAYDKALALGNMKLSSALVRLQDYIKAMDPGVPQTPQQIAGNQLTLLMVLLDVVNIEEHEFPVAWRALLESVRANLQGCFKVTMRNRGLYGMELGVMDNKNMRFITRILDLACVTAGVRDFSQVPKLVDIPKILDALPTARAKQNVTSFYAG